MKVGARNNGRAKVKAIKKGGVMAQVDLDVHAMKMSSVLTLDSLEELGIAPGDEVRVVVKAVHVLLVKD
jgi:molybdopterin-binding protein